MHAHTYEDTQTHTHRDRHTHTKNSKIRKKRGKRKGEKRGGGQVRKDDRVPDAISTLFLQE